MNSNTRAHQLIPKTIFYHCGRGTLCRESPRLRLRHRTENCGKPCSSPTRPENELISDDGIKGTERTLKTWRILLSSDFQAAVLSLLPFAWRSRESVVAPVVFDSYLLGLRGGSSVIKHVVRKSLNRVLLLYPIPSTGLLLSHSRFSPSFHFQVPPLTLMISRSYLYSYTPTTIHSFPCFSFTFHTSQEQDEVAHGLHSMICYWYMRIGIAIVGDPRRPGRPTRRSSHELGSLVISALPRRA